MVKVVEVPAGWKPPTDAGFALVEVEKSGAAYFSGIVAQMEENAAVFKANNAAPDIASAIDQAKAWAEERGVPVVYVVRPNTHRPPF